MIARVGHDTAAGLLNSYVATETMRTACLAAGAPAGAQAQPQIPAGSENMLGAEGHAMHGEAAVAGNYAYGW